MDRLRDLEIDSFDRDSAFSDAGSDPAMNQLRRNKAPVDSMLDSVFNPKQKSNPFITDTMSEINDEKEKNVLFSHSMSKGVFNDLRKSPLKNRLPENLQVYDPALEKRLFAKEARKMPGQGTNNRKSAASKLAPTAFTDPDKVLHKGVQSPLNKDLLMQSSKNIRFK